MNSIWLAAATSDACLQIYINTLGLSENFNCLFCFIAFIIVFDPNKGTVYFVVLHLVFNVSGEIFIIFIHKCNVQNVIYSF